jgi:hypothetical protein
MKKIIFPLVLILIQACSSKPTYEIQPMEELNLDELSHSFNFEKLEEAFAKAAINSSEAMLQLAEINNALQAPKMTQDQVAQANWMANYVPAGMDRIVNFYWGNSFMPALKMSADKSGYYILETNPNMKPLNPIIVTLDTEVVLYNQGKPYKNNRIIDVFRSISSQVDRFGVNIDIVEASNLIKVSYGN